MNLNDLALIYPESTCLEFSPKEREKAWQSTQNQSYSNTASYRAYLNCICVNIFLKYLKAEPDLHCKTLQIWQESDLPTFWSVVNGTAIDLDKIRLVLIPNDGDDFSELRIPREWVDLTEWAGNYYLAVSLNLEKCWLQIWGYATHQQLREFGKYDPMDETYSIPTEELVENLDIIWVAQELYPNSRPVLQPIPILSATEAENLLNTLSLPTPYSPRLEVPFSQWGSLMANDQWRKALYQRQQRQVETKIVQEVTTDYLNLGQWFQNVFEMGWQSLDAFLNTNTTSFAFSFRQSSSITREVTVEGVKLIDLGMQLGNQSVALLLGLTLEGEDRVAVRVQLFPASGDTFLPSNITLTLLSQSGKVLQQLQSRTQDNFIQLKRFSCSIGKKFRVRVSLNDFSLTEDFVITTLER